MSFRLGVRCIRALTHHSQQRACLCAARRSMMVAGQPRRDVVNEPLMINISNGVLSISAYLDPWRRDVAGLLDPHQACDLICYARALYEVAWLYAGSNKAAGRLFAQSQGATSVWKCPPINHLRARIRNFFYFTFLQIVWLHRRARAVMISAHVGARQCYLESRGKRVSVGRAYMGRCRGKCTEYPR